MTHVQEVMGSNPSTGYWMDIFSHIFVAKLELFACLKRPKINEKEAGYGPFFKQSVNIKHTLHARIHKPFKPCITMQRAICKLRKYLRALLLLLQKQTRFEGICNMFLASRGQSYKELTIIIYESRVVI